MPLARTVTGRDGLLNGIAASVTAGAAATLTAVGSRLRIQQTPPPPPPWRLVPAAARSLVSDARHHLPSSAVGILFGAAVGTAAGAVLLLSQMERRMRKPLRIHRSALVEALADEANATAAQPLSSHTQRAVLVQLLRRWVDAPPAFFDPPPFSKAAPAEARAAALLLARVHARFALSRIATDGPVTSVTAAHGGAGSGVSHGASYAAGDAAALTHGESCKLCWAAKCNTLYTPCGHVVACLECTAKLRRLSCPVCQGGIADVIQLFTT